jgi:DNA-directed RNA polymerase subunit M/transcription elongation factor TFIIS
MPAKTKSQQALMGMVHNYKKTGKTPTKNPEKIKKIAKGISKKAAKDFAKTKKRELPESLLKHKITTEEREVQSCPKCNKNTWHDETKEEGILACQECGANMVRKPTSLLKIKDKSDISPSFHQKTTFHTTPPATPTTSPATPTTPTSPTTSAQGKPISPETTALQKKDQDFINAINAVTANRKGRPYTQADADAYNQVYKKFEDTNRLKYTINDRSHPALDGRDITIKKIGRNPLSIYGTIDMNSGLTLILYYPDSQVVIFGDEAKKKARTLGISENDKSGIVNGESSNEVINGVLEKVKIALKKVMENDPNGNFDVKMLIKKHYKGPQFIQNQLERKIKLLLSEMRKKYQVLKENRNPKLESQVKEILMRITPIT